jgi:hypothetical protein
MDTGGPCRSHRGHGNPCGARPDPVRGHLLPQATTASSTGSMVGVRPPWPPSRPCRNRSGPAADPVEHFRCGRPVCRPGSGHADRPQPRPVCARRVRWLGEPVAGVAAAGAMQPAPVDMNNPGGQAAAELAADMGHRRPGKRAGLLEAEVLDLQPGHLAVGPAADDRLGDLVGVDTELGPGVVGPGAQLNGQVGQEDQLIGFSFGVAGEQRVDRMPGGWGTGGWSRAAGATTRTVPASGFAGGSRGQQAVERIRPNWSTKTAQAGRVHLGSAPEVRLRPADRRRANRARRPSLARRPSGARAASRPWPLLRSRPGDRRRRRRSAAGPVGCRSAPAGR